jgi:beta-aspartyl-peptidase (threonine type)
MSEKSLIPTHDADRYVLVIHGGAGIITREKSSPEQQATLRAALRDALLAGYDVLQAGGEAMDAAVQAVTVMEGSTLSLLPEHSPTPTSPADCPLFNAGKGAVFTTEGKVCSHIIMPY